MSQAFRALSRVLFVAAALQTSVGFAQPPSALERAMTLLRTDLSALPPTVESINGRDVDGKPVSSTSTTAYSNFAVSPQTCALSFHTKITVNGRVVRDAEDSVPISRAYTFDLTDSQLLDDQIPAMKNVREVPRQFLLRLLSFSGSYSYSFTDVRVAARVWADFATVFQLCTAASDGAAAVDPPGQDTQSAREAAPAATAVFAKAAYVGMELAMRHAYKTGKSTESAWKCMAAQDPDATFGAIYSAELNRVFTPKELADVERFFLSPLGKRYTQYMILQIYGAVGEAAPEAAPKFSDSELRSLNSFRQTPAGEKLLKHRFSDASEVNQEVRTKVLEVLGTCKSQALGKQVPHDGE